MSEEVIVSDCLAGGGDMGALMRSIDWSTTPVGPVSSWPQSLRTAVSILLLSRFPMYIAWGPGYVQFYNDGYRPILGSTKHPAAMGRGSRETFRESWHIIGPMFDAVMRGEAFGTEDWMLPLDRYGYLEECYFTFSYSPIRDETGGVGGVLVTVTETTERILGERRLRTLRDLAAQASEAKQEAEAWHGALEALSANLHDLPFALLYAVENGGRHARLVGTSNLARPSPAAPEHIALQNGPDGGWPLAGTINGERVQLVPDVRHRFGDLPGGAWPEPPHTALVLPITRPGLEHPYGFLVAGISARRAFDEPYRSFLEMVGSHLATAVSNAHAYEEERRRAEALAELDRAKTAFFSNVSHEFRTPLTLMLGPLEDLLARDGEAPWEAARAQVALVHRNGLRLLKLVNTLLDFSRIEAGRVQAVYEPTDLASLTADLASIFRAAIERAGMQLVVRCEPLPEPVYVDREMWEKIVLNLLSNAFKFTLEGTIEVQLRPGDSGAELTVRDTGTGIPQDELPYIFDRFHRVQGAVGRTHEGTGIGLSLVQELVRLHGGRLEAESVYGEGSTFRVIVPLGKAHLPEDRIGGARTLASTALGARPYLEEALRWLPDEPLAAEQAVSSSLVEEHPLFGPAHLPTAAGDEATRSARILLADDNADMRDYLRHLLSTRYEVEAVADGAAALEAARRNPPDLVLSDVMMPHLDGFDLVRALRADPQLHTVPILLLSARAGEEARVEGLATGADDYLIKPFSARELLARVHTHLQMVRLRAEAARREQALRAEVEEAMKRLEVVLTRITDAFLGLDAAWCYTYVNPQAAAMLGMPAEALLGRSIWETFPEADGGPLHTALQEAAAGQRATSVEYHFPARDRWLEVRAYPSPDGLSVFCLDITDRKRAEQQLRAFNETLEQRVRERTEALVGLNAQLHEEVGEREKAQQTLAHVNTMLEQRNRELQDFAYVASHDLQEPLRKIITFADMLRADYRHSLDEQGLLFLERMQAAALRMSNLIQDLLAFSRIASRGLTLVDVDLNQTVAEVLSDLEIVIREVHGIVEVGPMPTVEADPTQMRQLFQNLIGNALKFHQPGVPPIVRIRSSVEEDAALRDGGGGEDGEAPERQCRIMVQDNGIGFDEAYTERIFAPFERLHRSGKYPGTGMGLAICRRIVDRHRGSLTARSEPGTGSTFLVTLPLRQAPADPGSEAPAPGAELADHRPP